MDGNFNCNNKKPYEAWLHLSGQVYSTTFRAESDILQNFIVEGKLLENAEKYMGRLESNDVLMLQRYFEIEQQARENLCIGP